MKSRFKKYCWYFVGKIGSSDHKETWTDGGGCDPESSPREPGPVGKNTCDTCEYVVDSAGQ